MSHETRRPHLLTPWIKWHSSFLLSRREFKDLRLWFRLQRLVTWLFVIENLAQISLINPLSAVRAIVEMTFLANEIAPVQLAGDGRAEIGQLRYGYQNIRFV